MKIKFLLIASIFMITSGYSQEKWSLKKCVEYALENNISIKKLNTFPNSVIVSGENWHLGVLGIVASRLKDKYYRPSFVLSSSKGKLTGSARSISGIDVGKLIIKAVNKNLLVTGGGHKMAAGFSLYEDTFEQFRKFCEEEIYLQSNSTTLDKINYYD